MSPKRRSKGDGTLFKRSDGYWVGGIDIPTADGKRRYKRVVSKDRNTCLAKLRKLKADLEAGAIPTSGSTTVERWLTHWLESIQRPRVKPTTYRYYADNVRLYLIPTIGARRLDRLTAEDVRRMHRTVQESSTRNAQKAHQTLQMALKDAMREGLLPRNVAETAGKPKHVAAEQQAFTVPVSKHIIDTGFRHCDKSWAIRWALGFTTGARQGEMLGLTWDRVHLDTQQIDISWQLQEIQKTHGCGEPVDGVYPCGRVRVSFCPEARWNLPAGFEHRPLERSLLLTRPKSRSGRRLIAILPGMTQYLADLKAADTTNPHNLVFHHPSGKPFTPSQDQKQWTHLLAAAGVEHVKQHTMRHSTASLLMAYGVPATVIKDILGHSDVLTTQGYQHSTLELQRAAVQNLGALLPAADQI